MKTKDKVWEKIFLNPTTRMDLDGLNVEAYDFIVKTFRKVGHKVNELDNQVIIVFFDPKELERKLGCAIKNEKPSK